MSDDTSQSPLHPAIAAAAQPLSYATPFGVQATANDFYRDGKKLVTPRYCALPQNCVKCNAPADGFYRQKKFYWYPQWIIVVIVLSLLIGAILALALRKDAVVQLGLCRQHQKRRNTLMLMTWLMILGGIGILIGGFIYADAYRTPAAGGIGAVTGIVLCLLAIIPGSMSRMMTPTRMDKHRAWFTGCGPEFLGHFSSIR